MYLNQNYTPKNEGVISHHVEFQCLFKCIHCGEYILGNNNNNNIVVVVKCV